MYTHSQCTHKCGIIICFWNWLNHHFSAHFRLFCFIYWPRPLSTKGIEEKKTTFYFGINVKDQCQTYNKLLILYIFVERGSFHFIMSQISAFLHCFFSRSSTESESEIAANKFEPFEAWTRGWASKCRGKNVYYSCYQNDNPKMLSLWLEFGGWTWHTFQRDTHWGWW